MKTTRARLLFLLCLSFLFAACQGTIQTTSSTTVSTQSTPIPSPETRPASRPQTQQVETQVSNSVASDDLSKNMSALQADTLALTTFSFSDVMGNYETGWKTMQGHYNTASSDAQLGCGNNNANENKVSDEVGQISNDEFMVTSADGQLKIKKDQYNAQIAAVKRDMQLVTDNWKQVNQPSSKISQVDVDRTIKKGGRAIDNEVIVWNSIKNAADQYDQEVKTLKGKVDKIIPAMQCN